MSLETTESVEQTNEVSTETQAGDAPAAEATAEPPKTPLEALERAEAEEAKKTEAQAIIDLDKASKVKFQGKEYTPEQLRKMYMMQSDYSKKTAEVAARQKAFEQEQKFIDNLHIDLAAVRSNPALVEQFRATYPAKYHSYLNLITQQEQKAAEAKQEQAVQLPKEVQEKLAQFDEFKSQFEQHQAMLEEQKATAINAELDATFKELNAKYPYADEAEVVSRARMILEQNPNAQINKAAWDNLFKAANDRIENLVKSRQSQAVSKQKEANQKAAGPTTGGQTPMAAPKKFKSIREATDAVHASNYQGF